MRLKLLSLFLFIVVASSASNIDYKKGYYLEYNGNKVEGYIYYWSGSLIKFKPSMDSKPIKLTPLQVKSFHIGNTDCVVIFNFKAKPEAVIAGNKYKYGFAEVIEKGKINLYKFRIYVNNGMQYGRNDYYLIESESQITQAYRTGSRFRKQIIKFVSDNELLRKKILIEKLKYTDLEEIVEEYNLDIKNGAQQAIIK